MQKLIGRRRAYLCTQFLCSLPPGRPGGENSRLQAEGFSNQQSTLQGSGDGSPRGAGVWGRSPQPKKNRQIIHHSCFLLLSVTTLVFFFCQPPLLFSSFNSHHSCFLLLTAVQRYTFSRFYRTLLVLYFLKG